jgi:hypothetical protein
MIESFKSGSALVSMRIKKRIRIQHLGQCGSGSGSRVLMTKNKVIFKAEFFLLKIAI